MTLKLPERWRSALLCCGALLMLSGCDSGDDPAVIKVVTHENYKSATMAVVSGTLGIDAAHCLYLTDERGVRSYPAFPKDQVTVKKDGIEFGGRFYLLGDKLQVAGGGPAEQMPGFNVPPGCPSTSHTFVSPI